MALKFDHIAIQVENICDAVEWYSSNLNAKVLKSYDDWATLLVGNLCLSLTIDNHPSHIAFEVEDVDLFPCSAEEIKTHRDGSLFYYQEAPDGTIIEWIYWSKPKT